MADVRYYGVYRALVIETRDPAQKGRVRLRVPSLAPESPPSWALVATTTPSKGDTVIVAFEEGNVDSPIVIGTLWGAAETTPPG